MWMFVLCTVPAAISWRATADKAEYEHNASKATDPAAIWIKRMNTRTMNN